MSWDVTLTEKDKIVEVKPHYEGGIITKGGSTYATLNITYNYSKQFHDALDEEKGLDWLSGATGKEAALRLKLAIEKLGNKPDDDYWKDTPGNAGHALSILLGWALQHPNAIFEVV